MARPISPFLGLALRRARRDAKLSQRALAARAGVPVSTLSQAETGSRDLPVDAAFALLSACGWDLRVVDRDGRPVQALPLGDEGPRDRGHRRYPPHVQLRSTEGRGSWWGDRWGPYWGRPPRPDLTFDLPSRPYPGAVTEAQQRGPRGSEQVRQVQRVGAYAVIVDGGGRVLLTRLTARTSQPGWWTLPGGGVEHGEHPADAMVREVQEETGLTVGSHRLIGVDSIRRGVGELGRVDDFHAIRIVYHATVVDETAPLVHEADGSTDLARWVPVEDTDGLCLVDLARTGLALAAS